LASCDPQRLARYLFLVTRLFRSADSVSTNGPAIRALRVRCVERLQRALSSPSASLDEHVVGYIRDVLIYVHGEQSDAGRSASRGLDPSDTANLLSEVRLVLSRPTPQKRKSRSSSASSST
jgi:hypothetical protein